MLPAWEELSDSRDDEARAWSFLYDQLHFHPSVYAEHWPGISEPRPSITYSMGHMYEVGPDRAAELERDLHLNALTAFQACLATEQRMYALDWQHLCYWFYPYRPFNAVNPDAWSVRVWPDGDYFIFLADDFRFGLFGHPWEQTICIFGQPLLDAFRQYHPKLLSDVIRVNGQSIGKEGSTAWIAE